METLYIRQLFLRKITEKCDRDRGINKEDSCVAKLLAVAYYNVV